MLETRYNSRGACLTCFRILTQVCIKDRAKSGLRHGQSAILPKEIGCGSSCLLSFSPQQQLRDVEGVRRIEDQLPNLRCYSSYIFLLVLGIDSFYVSHLSTAKTFLSIAFYCTLSCFQPSIGSYTHCVVSGRITLSHGYWERDVPSLPGAERNVLHPDT